MKINKKLGKKKFIGIVLLLLIVAAGAYFVFAKYNHYPPFASEQKTYQPGEQKISMEKSETEKQATKVLQDDPSQKTQNTQTDTPPKPTTNSSSGKQSVNVLVTNAGIFNGTVSASGMVTNLATDQGTCTYTFSNGSHTLTKTSQPLVNPTSTTCSTVTFPSTELAVSGTWQVVLGFESSSATGQSSAKEFTK